MSLTAPIKPTLPTVPAIKLQSVESDSQNTAQTAPPPQSKTVEKPAVNAKIEKTEPAANNQTVINKVEPNDQNKVPLLNGAQSSESVKANTAVADTPPAAQNKLSSFDIYASVFCLVLFIGVVLFFFWRQKAAKRNPRLNKNPGQAKRQKSGSKAAVPRTVIDYSADNTREILDMLTSPHQIQADNAPVKGKITKEVTSNFEFRI
ncbi:MAG: hypothetical protein LLG02_03015 [Pelosinus sp.]|nr:hypothetical protein [Pelosinus sp.]